MISLYAIYKDLNLFLLNSSMDAFILVIVPLSKGSMRPVSGSKYELQNALTFSAPPLENNRQPLGNSLFKIKKSGQSA